MAALDSVFIGLRPLPFVGEHGGCSERALPRVGDAAAVMTVRTFASQLAIWNPIMGGLFAIEKWAAQGLVGDDGAT